jgi:hypothetical protein
MASHPICPKCKTNDCVYAKLILIGKLSPIALFGDEQAGYIRKDQLAVDECKLELLKKTPLEQFVDGFFCDKCGHGFLDNQIVIDSVKKDRWREWNTG